jgi:hypothetical protein
MSFNEETLSKSFGLAEKSYFLCLWPLPPPQYSRWFCFNIGIEILNSVSGGISYSTIGSKKVKKDSREYGVFLTPLTVLAQNISSLPSFLSFSSIISDVKSFKAVVL